MDSKKIVKAYCPVSKKYYGLIVEKFGSQYEVVDFIPLKDDEGKLTVTEVPREVQSTFKTHRNLLACLKCGNRTVSGCRCTPKNGCNHEMKYRYSCIYCQELKIDYSVPSRADLGKHKAGETIKLSQGKEIKIVTFSNVSWTKFDNIRSHPSGQEFNEPKVHLIANEENIEFHGYNVSEMDEGVYYEIGQQDDFVIECDVDTSTIKPHPGGYLYINFGILTANIELSGGKFFLRGRQVATTSSRFKMKLSLTECGKYQVFINGELKGQEFEPVNAPVRIIFGFRHDSHYCYDLSHAYLRGIKMAQGVDSEQ